MNENINNELVTVDNETGEILNTSNPYNQLSTYTPESQDDKIKLYNLLHGDGSTAKPFRNSINQVLQVDHVITNPYTNKKEQEHGVISYLHDTKSNEWYVTSSKTVYYNLMNMFNVFGESSEDNVFELKITSERKQNGEQISLELIGVHTK